MFLPELIARNYLSVIFYQSADFTAFPRTRTRKLPKWKFPKIIIWAPKSVINYLNLNDPKIISFRPVILWIGQYITVTTISGITFGITVHSLYRKIASVAIVFALLYIILTATLRLHFFFFDDTTLHYNFCKRIDVAMHCVAVTLFFWEFEM